MERHIKRWQADQGRNESPFLIRLRDLETLQRSGSVNEPLYPGDVPAVEAVTDLHRFLAKRGIALLVVPQPFALQVVGPSLVGRNEPNVTIWPGYWEFVKELAHRDVEVVELVDLFRGAPSYAGLLNRYDHHWAPRGIALASERVAAKLRRRFPAIRRRARYQFWASRVQEKPCPLSTLYQNKLLASRNAEVPSWVEPTRTIETVYYQGKLCPIPNAADSPVVVIGNSCAHHGQELGSSFSQFLSRDLGFLVDDRSRSGGTRDAPWVLATEVWPRRNLQVVVLVIRANNPERLGPDYPWRLASEAFQGRSNPESRPITATVRLQDDPCQLEPVQAEYANAIFSVPANWVHKPDNAPGGQPVLRIWGMVDRQLQSAANWRSGDVLKIRALPWTSAVRKTKGLANTQVIDTVPDIDRPRWWVLNARIVE
ncbi:MAG: alginate O-acetyltransferase AlgX-related protein [Phycisphaerae bacterium]